MRSIMYWVAAVRGGCHLPGGKPNYISPDILVCYVMLMHTGFTIATDENHPRWYLATITDNDDTGVTR